MIVGEAEFLAELLALETLARFEQVEVGTVGVELVTALHLPPRAGGGDRPRIVYLMAEYSRESRDRSCDAQCGASREIGRRVGIRVGDGGQSRYGYALCRLEIDARRVVVLIVENQIPGSLGRGLPAEAGAESDGVLSLKIGAVCEVFHVAVVLARVNRDTEKERVGDERTVDVTIRRDGVEIAETQRERAGAFVGRPVARKGQRARLHPLAKLRGLRPLEHLHVVQIEKSDIGAVAVAQQDPVLKYRHARLHPGIAGVGGDATKIEADLIGRLSRDEQSRDE